MRIPTLVSLALLSSLGCEPNRTVAPDYADYETDTEVAVSCLPNLDGRIDSAELTPSFGVAAAYLVSEPGDDVTDTPVADTAGVVGTDGRRLWDWSAVRPTDRVAELGAEPLGEQWYAGSFPGGQFAVPLDAGATLKGIYTHDEGGLWLHGAASTDEAPAGGQTLLVYEEPIPIFVFPLNPGDQWTVTARVRDGVLRGVAPWSQDEVYTTRVAEAGELRLPDFTFSQALQVRTHLVVKPLAVGTEVSVRQVSYVFECFGEVARATSPTWTDSEPDPGEEFSLAAEIRRLGWL